MKTFLTALFAITALSSATFSQSSTSATATMYQDTGMQKDGYGTVYHTFNIWYGTVTVGGVFTVSSTTKRYEAKPGSAEEAFMRAASGYDAWCVVPDYELRNMGVQAAKYIKQGGTHMEPSGSQASGGSDAKACRARWSKYAFLWK